ncbi:Signal transduction histidine-protein kinase BarA [Serratia rubidaea]|uniref:Signal transduction histidine-protein kinase BarA n=1 Tax=Serratia rubidaea TaxID=61652 RepID=A0A447QPD5_SERRU|nr:Signal transduction histidine-protein kinase BarA [Serratia rubidaea]
MLLDFLPQVRERVQAVLDGAQDDTLLDLIHKLHGSCSYSGVPRLKQLCSTLNKQLRQGVAIGDLEPEWLELLDEIELVSEAGQKTPGLSISVQPLPTGRGRRYCPAPSSASRRYCAPSPARCRGVMQRLLQRADAVQHAEHRVHPC